MIFAMLQPIDKKQLKKIANLAVKYFFVIGAYNSSNSIRLVEVAKKYGAKKSIFTRKHRAYFDENIFRRY